MSKSVQDLSVRLEEILNIRVVHEQLTRYRLAMFFISVTYSYLCYFMIDSSFSLDIFCLISKSTSLPRLLSESEQVQLNTATAFAPFSQLNALYNTPFTLSKWRAAVSQYERGEFNLRVQETQNRKCSKYRISSEFLSLPSESSFNFNMMIVYFSDLLHDNVVSSY